MANVFSKIGQWFKKTFSVLLRIFKDFFKKAFSELEKIVIAEFKEVAIEIVSTLKTTDLTSEEKRKAAFKELKKLISVSKYNVRDGLINALIEIAYSYVVNNPEKE